MPFALIIDNVIERYPYNTKEDYPNASFLEGEDTPEMNVYWVHSTTPENPDTKTLKAVESTPLFSPIRNRWEQSWVFIEKTPEELQQERYNPGSFLLAMYSSLSFAEWVSLFTPFQQTAIANVATNAKIDNNWSAMQMIYDQLKEAIAPDATDIAEWQEAADLFGIPLTF